MDRSRLESLVWKFTNKDYKSVVDGKRSVIVNGPDGATLTPLARLTDEQLQGLRGHRMAGKAAGTPGNADSWNVRSHSREWLAERHAEFVAQTGRPSLPPGTTRG